MDWKKDRGIKEDARYKAAMGPGSMEWGTDVGDKYFRSLTPGQSSDNRKSLIKPLPIKARKDSNQKVLHWFMFILVPKNLFYLLK